MSSKRATSKFRYYSPHDKIDQFSQQVESLNVTDPTSQNSNTLGNRLDSRRNEEFLNYGSSICTETCVSISNEQCSNVNEPCSSTSNEPGSSNLNELCNSIDRHAYSQNICESNGSNFTNACNTNTKEHLSSSDIEQMSFTNAQMKTTLKKNLSVNALHALRKQHGLSSYIRSKRDIVKALQEHVCEENCNLNRLSTRKRRRQEKENWPVIISEEERHKIISEFVQCTSKNTLQFKECSFCGVQSNVKQMREYPINKLDISYLLEKRTFLRNRFNVQHIEISKPFEDKYIVCATCLLCIRRNKFEDVPLYSYANGCWIGDVPEELQNLTLLEELCIARVRSTRCTIKLSSGKLSQYGSHGNVCVFPQEPKNLINVLPPPLHSMYDEIAVILVNNRDSKITEDLLKKSPLLVRRNKIANALTWLKKHNALYSDIIISQDNLKEYTEEGMLLNCPAQHILESDSEGSGYVPNTVNVPSDGNGNTEDIQVMQTCGVLDSDEQERSQTLRKLDMIKELLAKKTLIVKYPNASSQPLPTFKNGKLYALLWPTLFPYGLGSFEEDVRNLKTRGFRNLHMKRHVKYLLNLTDTRFQTHVTFPFVMMNLLQRRVSSYESRLIVKRSFFPTVIDLIKKIDVDNLESVKDKILKKIPLEDGEMEKSVTKLLNYVNFLSEDICGSIGEVKKMKSEIRSIMRVKGLPHLFLTINPADTMNPIMQVFTGRDINLNRIFHDLSNGKENAERARSTIHNPAGTARAFDTVIKAFVDILLGKERDGQLGVFGPVESYYGVVEAQGRGSLHCHFFIWLKDGMDPFEIHDKLKANDEWRKHFFSWLETAVKQDLPTDTIQPNLGDHKKEPLTSRPQIPECFSTKDEFRKHYHQDLRNLLHVTGQIHEHFYMF